MNGATKATGRVGVGLALVGAIALLAAPVAAKKKAAPGKVKTETAATTTTADAQLVTVPVECPKGTKVVGGGYTTGFSSEGASPTDFHVVIESRRDGAKAWTVSAYRQDGGAAGPALPVNAEAYCRSGTGKLKEVQAVEPAFAATNTLKPEAACPLNRAIVAGGFSFSVASFTTVNQFHNISRPIGSVGWTIAAVTPTSVNKSATAIAYCQKRKPLPQRTGAAQISAINTGTATSADSASCPGTRSALAGGFQAPDVFAAAGTPLIVESRRAEKRWRVGVVNLGLAPGTGQFSSIALCG